MSEQEYTLKQGTTPPVLYSWRGEGWGGKERGWEGKERGAERGSEGGKVYEHRIIATLDAKQDISLT